MNSRALLDIRRPLIDLERRLVSSAQASPGALPAGALDAFRYILSFARLTVVRCADGQDVSVSEMLARHRRLVCDTLTPRLALDERPMSAVARALPVLREATVATRGRLLEHFSIDRPSLEAEVCQRQLVIVSGGGGGSGYGYAGAFALLHRSGLQPELLAGTSIGALSSLFRARRRIFDSLPMIEAARLLRWNNVFEVLNISSRYGVPATLRLYLRRSLGPMMRTASGEPLTFRNIEIPTLIVTTGITVDGLKHDLSYYEHFLDDVVRPGMVFRASKLKRLQQVGSLVAELMSTPDALREVVFGQDPLTMDAEVLDAAGFSAAVPGLIHYDVLRDDPRTKALLNGLYAEYGITRLGEGGLVNNVPARPAFTTAMSGALGGRRNPFILALDCFSPRPRSLLWYPIQQIAALNVRRNRPYMDLYFALDRVLSPASVVPTVRQLTTAMAWTTDELTPVVPLIQEMCRPHPVLQAQASTSQAS
jgi:predicted acylesterase/phospholipase RssA